MEKLLLFTHTWPNYRQLFRPCLFYGCCFFGLINWLFYVMIIVGIIETIEEIMLIFIYPKWVEGVKGIPWAIHDIRRCKNKH